MIDLQAVYIRDLAKLSGVRFLSMIRVEATPAEVTDSGFTLYKAKVAAEGVLLYDSTFLSVTRVLVNGYEAGFINTDPSVLLIAMPQQAIDNGIPIEGVTEIQIKRTANGAETEQTEIVSDLGGPGGAIDTLAFPGTRRVTLDSGILQISGDSLNKAVGVRVNYQSQGFVILDNRTVLCTLPEKAQSIDEVEVITSSNKISRSSLFAYLFTDNISVVSAEFKLVQQFVKVLLTTPGSDAFNKTLGGNLQNWVGQKVAANNTQALVAKTVLNIVNTGARFAAQQGLASVPPEERLSDVQVLNIGFSSLNPSVMDLSLRLNTFARRQASISLLIGTAEEAIKSVHGL